MYKMLPTIYGKICLAYSLLAEEEIVGGCEGDVNNTVTMKILFNLTENRFTILISYIQIQFHKQFYFPIAVQEVLVLQMILLK